jgi:hypothetical protein
VEPSTAETLSNEAEELSRQAQQEDSNPRRKPLYRIP